MVTILPISTKTEREWNFRDDNNQHFFGVIPDEQKFITLTLNWKPNRTSKAKLVGRYKLDFVLLLSEGFVRKVDKGIQLRFQRTGEIIEIAISSKSPALAVGRKPPE
jgi:hypothetical protein